MTLRALPTSSSPKRMPFLVVGRPYRVMSAILTICVLSMADLYITLMYLRSGGMGEANPVARWIMAHGSANLLIAWKAISIGVASIIFYVARRTRVAEIGAWMCVLLLTWLTIRWARYSEEVHRLTPEIHELSSAEYERWVRMDP